MPRFVANVIAIAVVAVVIDIVVIVATGSVVQSGCPGTQPHQVSSPSSSSHPPPLLPPPQGGGTVLYDHGYISSPNYPDKYYMDAVCRWTIAVQRWQTIHITMFDFELDVKRAGQCHDYLEIAPVGGAYERGEFGRGTDRLGGAYEGRHYEGDTERHRAEPLYGFAGVSGVVMEHDGGGRVAGEQQVGGGGGRLF